MTVRRIPLPFEQVPVMMWFEQPYRSWPRIE